MVEFATASILPAEDYERVAAAISFIESHRQQQPDLARVAHHVHLSESHFQKMFTRWAGVSPKRFLELLTLEDTKRRLATAQSLLSITLETGLSSPSRLHDLYIRFEAMTPATYRQGGEGLAIAYGFHPTRFGTALIATTERGICSLQFCHPGSTDTAINGLQQRWPRATFILDPSRTQPIQASLQGLPQAPTRPLSLFVKGTNFQIQVWRALLRLPFGSLATYQDIANDIGKPKAARAVGTAIGANPIGYLIPCHRVIRRTAELGGYRWGQLRKAAMVGWEASQQETQTP
ncbi:MAG: methylated-DNA--[protein]-cysteine S-methyltransferase [Leptolyngbyaceae cyanobacterium]